MDANGQQTDHKKGNRKALTKDTLDGKFDFSRFLIDAHGFIPVPLIITEPALGGFGAAVAPVFLTPKKGLPKDAGYIPPDITAGFGMYTVNGSWAFGGIRIGTFPKAGIKYRVGGAYANINMSYYREIPSKGEQEFAFNIRALPVLASVSKKISKKGLYAGIQYSFANMKLSPRFDVDLPDFIPEKEMDSNIGTLGIFMDWDNRNTVFTPDRGIRINALFSMNDNWTGSSYEFQKTQLLLNWFFPVKKNWISGLRVEGHRAFGSPPFFAYPFVNLRGVPLYRYQGQTVLVIETEQRFDLNFRWSAIGFAGYGKTMFEKENFSGGNDVYNIGGGFRYLIARSFGLRTGIDIAKGPDDWGWYLVFGHNWNR
jgi:Omp85 superfamily domain